MRLILPSCRLLLAVIAAAAFSGCAGPFVAFEACPSGRAPDYPALLERLERSTTAERGRDRLLYLLEKGLLQHEAGELTLSNATLEEADRLAEDLFTKSLSVAGFSFISNDLVLPYTGEDFEIAYINYFKALNYLQLGDLDAARVECRRVDEKLNLLVDAYGDKNVFRESPLLRLLTGLIYEAQGEWNDAFIAYRKSLEAFEAYQDKYRVEVPRQLWERLLFSARRSGLLDEFRSYQQRARALGIEAPPDAALIAVIVNAGLVPRKVEGSILVPGPEGYPIRLAWPRLVDSGCRPRPPLVRSAGVAQSAELIEDLAAIAQQSLKDKQGRTIAKMFVRMAARQVAARQLEQEFGPLAGFATQITSLLVEQADTRAWSTLPGGVYLALLPAARGVQGVAIETDGGLLERQVQVGANGIGFVVTRIY